MKAFAKNEGDEGNLIRVRYLINTITFFEKRCEGRAYDKVVTEKGDPSMTAVLL